jgi:hypothetical protein
MIMGMYFQSHTPMADKKTAKKAAAKKATKDSASQPANKATARKTTVKKSSTPKKKAEKKSSPSIDSVARSAYLNYRRRVENGLPGDSHGDWLEAERQLREEG